MFTPEPRFERADELPVKRLGFLVFAHVGKDVGKVVEHGERIAMVRAANALHRLPSPAIKRLGGCEVALVAQHHREVVAARERVRMIRPERFFPRRLVAKAAGKMSRPD
jgi:hypothetical protein